ncbi:hypothetical protein F6X51_27145 [Methylobacterium planeticum]|uniref:Uncharacterized protein n=2 Tax=Methylobacterium planeticum TaxID=2615211 RepID=A0A6N6MC50_9HYPH|nr:hypothetical protein F6X51_27145 [Methylobacterium planeticum]
MTPRERAAFRAGIETMRQIALLSAVNLEVRDDARELRQQAAVAALQGLAEGAKELMLGTQSEASPVQRAFALIADEPGESGEIPCPTCASRLHWARDASNGHVHGQCETDGCLRWMQ